MTTSKRKITPSRQRAKLLKQERLAHANALIEIIASHGRKFFWNGRDKRMARLEIDYRGKVWLIDEYRGHRVFTHHVCDRWRGFSHGGTLRDLIIQLREYVCHGTLLHFGYIAPGGYSYGDLWGYGDAAGPCREAAAKLPIIDPTTIPKQETAS